MPSIMEFILDRLLPIYDFAVRPSGIDSSRLVPA
jgi:hypothetical protein